MQDFQTKDLLALPLTMGFTYFVCVVADKMIASEISIFIALLAAITFGRFSRQIIRKLL